MQLQIILPFRNLYSNKNKYEYMTISLDYFGCTYIVHSYYSLEIASGIKSQSPNSTTRISRITNITIM